MSTNPAQLVWELYDAYCQEHAQVESDRAAGRTEHESAKAERAEWARRIEAEFGPRPRRD
jgi:FtsZ-binding cell division protein ZapB